MKAFRIGRKPTGPWMNMTPPIRAASSDASATVDRDSAYSAPALAEKNALLSAQGNLRVDAATDHGTFNEKSADDGDEAATIANAAAPNCLQTGCQVKPSANGCSRRPSPSGALLTPPPEVVDEKALEAASLLPRGRKQMSPEKYTEWAMQQQRETDMGEYPSLDHDVQLAITAKYMKLHEQIDRQGLYECPYFEYAKEMSRYLTLFAVSMVGLYKGWYMTSAFFLGLFWVCCIYVRLYHHR